MTKNNKKGFTLVELMVVLTIISIIFAILFVLVDPTELVRRGRDDNRLEDMSNIQKAINIALQDAGDGVGGVLCNNQEPPCEGFSDSSDSSNRSIDGTGWVKINFSTQSNIAISTLPVDPVNNSTFRYSYKSDGSTYELNTVLESKQYKHIMVDDGGDNPNFYEAGTKLKLFN